MIHICVCVFLVSVPGRCARVMRRCGLKQMCCSNPVPTSDSVQSSPRIWVPNPHYWSPTRRSKIPMTRELWADTWATTTGNEQRKGTGGTNFLTRWDSQLPRVLTKRDLDLLYQNTLSNNYPSAWEFATARGPEHL